MLPQSSLRYSLVKVKVGADVCRVKNIVNSKMQNNFNKFGTKNKITVDCFRLQSTIKQPLSHGHKTNCFSRTHNT